MRPKSPAVTCPRGGGHFDFLGPDSLEQAIHLFLDTEAHEHVHQWPPLFLSRVILAPAPVIPQPVEEEEQEHVVLPPSVISDAGPLAPHDVVEERAYPPSPPSGGVTPSSRTVTPPTNGGTSTATAMALPESLDESDICPPAVPVAVPVPSTESVKPITVFKNRDDKRRLTFRMVETPDITRIQSQPDVWLERTYQICGVDLKTEDTESLDGDWDESQMEEPTQIQPLSDEKFVEMLLHELELANDESDRLARDIFEGGGSPVISSEEEIGGTALDPVRLRVWFDRVAESYRKGVQLVKVSMRGDKLLRTVKVGTDTFSVSVPPDGCRSTHLSYVNRVSMGYASGEFMRLIETTELGSEIPLVQGCAVVRMPSRSVSLVFPTEMARNEFLLLMRVKLRATKYIYGDGSLAVLRANTSGRAFRPLGTFQKLEDLREQDQEEDEEAPGMQNMASSL